MTYEEVGREYRRLQQQVKAGQLTEDELRARLEEMMLEDDRGVWWVIGYETGQWYFHDGEKWVRGEPPTSPPSAPEAQAVAPSSATPLQTSPQVASVSQPVETAPATTSTTAGQPISQQSQLDQAVEPRSERNRRSPLLAGVIGVLIIGVLAVAAYLVFGRNPASAVASPPATAAVEAKGPESTPTLEAARPTETQRVVVLVNATSTTPATGVVAETSGRAATSAAVAAALPASVSPTATETAEPATPTPSPTSMAPAATGTAEPAITTSVPTPIPAAPTSPPPPTLAPTRRPATATPASPVAAPPLAAPGTLADFERFGSWARGNEPYGTLTQSADEKHGGAFSAKLAYDFPAVQNDYVVFVAKPAIGLPGRPTALSVWVYGDGSEHFLNVWVQDSAGEVRQFSFGRITHSGSWQQMTAPLDTSAAWPQTRISGPDNGRLDYPVRLYALVLDAIQGPEAPSKGVLYLDDLKTVEQ